MGSKLSRAVRRITTRHHRRLLLVGLDGAGKSTVLARLAVPEAEEAEIHTVPTIGANYESVRFGKWTMKIWDVGGQTRLRPYWRHYFEGVQGLVFVIDSSDTDRFNAVIAELKALAGDPLLQDASFLLLANKTDLPRAYSAEQLKDRLQLQSIFGDKPYQIVSTVATRGDGLEEGIEFLSQTMKPI